MTLIRHFEQRVCYSGLGKGRRGREGARVDLTYSFKSVRSVIPNRAGVCITCVSLRGVQRPKQFKVVGLAPTVMDLLNQVAEHQPDITLVSVNLGSSPMGVYGPYES